MVQGVRLWLEQYGVSCGKAPGLGVPGDTTGTYYSQLIISRLLSQSVHYTITALSRPRDVSHTPHHTAYWVLQVPAVCVALCPCQPSTTRGKRFSYLNLLGSCEEKPPSVCLSDSTPDSRAAALGDERQRQVGSSIVTPMSHYYQSSVQSHQEPAYLLV